MAETINNKKISQLSSVNNWYDLKQSDIIPIVASNTTSQVSMSKFVQYVTQWSAKTGSNSFIGNQSVTGNVSVSNDLTVGGTLTVKKMLVDVTSASVIYQDGSTKFGDTVNDTHEYTGSVKISGSLSILGANIGNILYAYTSSTNAIHTYTSSLKSAITVTGTDVSVAGSVTASNLLINGAITASNLLITGTPSLGNDSADVTTITGKLVVTNGITGSLQNGIYKGGNTEGSAFSIGSNDNYAVSLKTNNIDRLLISTAGNLGIGTGQTSARVHISGSSARTLLLQSYTSSGNNYIEFWDNSGQRTSYIGHGSITNDFYYYLTGSTDCHLFYTSGSSRLVITETGNVGIGTASPNSRFHISDTNQNIVFLSGSNTSGYTLNIGLGNDGVNFANNSNARGFNFKNTNGSLVTIDSTGNVGIGTTSPGQKLDISGSIRIQGTSTLILSGSTNTINAGSNTSFTKISGGTSATNSSGSGIYLSGNTETNTGRLHLWSGNVTGNHIRFDTSGTEQMRIDQLGYIGVGTTIPTGSIDILRNSSTVPAIRIKSGDIDSSTFSISMNTGATSLIFDSSKLGSGATQAIDFRTDNTSRLKISSAGNVGVGTDAANKFHVGGDTYLSGSVKHAFRTSTTNTTISATSDYYVFLNGTNITGSLPAALNNTGITFKIKNINASTALIQKNGSDTISGATSYSLTQNSYITVVSDGSATWHII
jgi:hypothetical protein